MAERRMMSLRSEIVRLGMRWLIKRRDYRKLPIKQHRRFARPPSGWCRPALDHPDIHGRCRRGTGGSDNHSRLRSRPARAVFAWRRLHHRLACPLPSRHLAGRNGGARPGARGRLSTGSRKSVPGGARRRCRGLPLAAGPWCRSPADRGDGRFGRRRAGLFADAAVAGRGVAAAFGRCRFVALDRSCADRAVAPAQRGSRSAAQRRGPAALRRRLSRRRRSSDTLCLAAIRRSRRTASDDHPGRQRRGAPRRLPCAWPSACVLRDAKSSSKYGRECRTSGTSSCR